MIHCHSCLQITSNTDWFTARSSAFLGTRVQTATWHRRFRALFGVSFQILLSLWDILQQNAPVQFRREHLLWGLYFLKVYPTETVASCFFAVTEKTWRKWIFVVVQAISQLE